MELKISDVLDRAADKIAPEGAWTQKTYARSTPKGRGVGVYSPKAICWCAVGAIFAVAGRDGVVAVRVAIALREYLAVSGVAHWNDEPERKQEEVVTALREAARREREAGR
jgi:hypothetical protein